MASSQLPRHRYLAVLSAVALTVAGLLTAGPAHAAPDHDTVVSEVPSTDTPHILDGNVYAIHDAGSKVIAAGSFTQAQNRGASATPVTRKYVLAFDKATGTIDTAFAPVLDDEVTAVIAGPTAGTVYLAGRFNTVDGVNRRKVALLNVSDGSLVAAFKGPAFNGTANDIVRAGDRLLVGGIFTTATATSPRGGLASLDAATGALDDYLTTELTVNHNWTTGSTGAKAGVGAEKLALSPDGKQLVVIGNFKKADGVTHDQIVKLDLGASSASIADWNTDRYTPACRSVSFDSYMRDVAFSPDSRYFVVVTTGAAYAGTLCDSAARWDATATGAGQEPTWTNYSGGDTFLSVGISEKAVYVGGHIRWVNNTLGRDKAEPGAVGRASIAALDPANGLPLSWNPGRNPRGYGVTEMLVTPQGLWLGSDQEWIGDFEYKRARIAFFPLTGGDAPHSTATKGLPGKVYQAGKALQPEVLHRVNAGGPAVPAIDGGPDWAADTATAPSPYHNTGSKPITWATPVASVDSTVPSSTPLAVYTDERYDPNTYPAMQWEFPVAAGTQIQVRLYLAERYSATSAVGARMYDVSIDGSLKLDNFDAVAQTGFDRGTMRAFTITSDGLVDIDFAHVKENPLVQAIEIVKTGPPPPVANVLHRVNAGGPALTATDGGPDWAADTAATPSPLHNTGSSAITWPTAVGSVDATVPAGTPAALYTDERWDPNTLPSMQWDFPVPAGTPVQVRLYLGERYSVNSAANSRIYDVSLDGVLRLDNFDAVAATGFNRGTMRGFNLTSDGNVDIDFAHVKENPLVHAIEIVKLNPAPPAATLDSVTVRTYDGVSAVGDATTVANPDDTKWSTTRGAFWVGGTLFYGMNGALYRRSFDGDTFGTPQKVDPYHDELWDTVETGSGTAGQTYAGSTTNFYAEIPNVTGMFYSAGRVYYTLGGQNSLYWRWFTPDSGTVGAERFTFVSGSSLYGGSGGMFLSGDGLYVVDRNTGDLRRANWTGDPADDQFSTVLSGPGTDGVDWRATAVFVGP